MPRVANVAGSGGGGLGGIVPAGGCGEGSVTSIMLPGYTGAASFCSWPFVNAATGCHIQSYTYVMLRRGWYKGLRRYGLRGSMMPTSATAGTEATGDSITSASMPEIYSALALYALESQTYLGTGANQGMAPKRILAKSGKSTLAALATVASSAGPTSWSYSFDYLFESGDLYVPYDGLYAVGAIDDVPPVATFSTVKLPRAWITQTDVAALVPNDRFGASGLGTPGRMVKAVGEMATWSNADFVADYTVLSVGDFASSSGLASLTGAAGTVAAVRTSAAVAYAPLFYQLGAIRA